jgi:hypothetical protein
VVGTGCFALKRANRIFISYRRGDSAGITGRVYDRLVQKFGKGAIFKDVDSIPLGANFKQYVDSVIEDCDVAIVVIGDRWLGGFVDGAAKSRRIDDPRDFVRIEIESALQRNVPVIPLLVQDALMPAEENLPASLQELAYRNGMAIRHDPHFHADMDRLIKNLDMLLAARAYAPVAHAPVDSDRLSRQSVAKETVGVPAYHKESVAELTPSVDQTNSHDLPVHSFQTGSGWSSRLRWLSVVVIVVLIVVAITVFVLIQHLRGIDKDSASASGTPQPANAKAGPSPNPNSSVQNAVELVQGQLIRVRIEAMTVDSWVEYQVDQEKSEILVLKPGESKDLPPAHELVKLTLGNRLAVNLKINDREASLPANTGNFAAQVIISRENLQTYFQ